MYYQRQRTSKKESLDFSLGVICICVVLLLAMASSRRGGMIHLRIRDGTRNTYTFQSLAGWRRRSALARGPPTVRGAGAWDLCVAAAYNPRNGFV